MKVDKPTYTKPSLRMNMNQLEFELEKHHSVIRKKLREYGVWPDADGRYLLHDVVWAMADNPVKIEDRIRMDTLADENERLRRKASLMSLSRKH